MMNEIKEKYKDDPQKMNAQIMNLYKEYGVNPAAGCLPLLLQMRLLRVLEEGKVYRVGGENPVRISVRVIAATRVDLEKAVDDGLFREDLYYRLNVMEIFIPPLRERKEDIEPLARFFLGKHLPKANKKITQNTFE